MKKLSSEDKAVFIALEPSGFKMYREIKRAVLKNKVPIGWEPWYKGDPINFWGNSVVACQSNDSEEDIVATLLLTAIWSQAYLINRKQQLRLY